MDGGNAATSGVGQKRWPLLGQFTWPLTGVTATAFSPVFAFATMGLFGAAYIVATGVFLIQGIKLMPDRPDLGLGIPFLSLALGQAIGTPLFGAAMNAIGTLGALAMFAAAACVAIFFKPRRKGVVLN